MQLKYRSDSTRRSVRGWAIVAIVAAGGIVRAEPGSDARKIERTLRSAQRSLARCYRHDKPLLTRGYRFEIAIAKSGQVTRTTIHTGDATRDACLSRTVGHLTFPPLSSDVVVSYPLNVDPA